MAGSLLIIALAAVALYRLLHDLDVAGVYAAIRGMAWQRIVLATILVAGSYATLTMYDYFALRTLGFGHVRYGSAALGGFTSYAIGHSIGATTIVAGAVRYRIYSAHGLDALAVAKVCMVAGLTFWLGNAAMLGMGVALVPDAASAIDQLPPAWNRLAAWLVLAGLVLYTAWVWRGSRRVGKRESGIVLPGGPSTLLQIAIGALDLSFAAAAMYVLCPGTGVGEGEPMRFAVVFVCATLLGFASHAPGGLGAFDAAMLLGLPSADKAHLLAALIVFRILYHFVPLTLAVALLAAREVVCRLAREDAAA